MAHTTGTLKSASWPSNSCPSRESCVANWLSVIPTSQFRSAPAINIFSLALRTTTAFKGWPASAVTATRKAAQVSGLKTFAEVAEASKVIQPTLSASTV